ncbi:MAG: hypothetical protein ACJAQW_001195 [Paracoccaceae bacterium]|jgi:hypothetical protein
MRKPLCIPQVDARSIKTVRNVLSGFFPAGVFACHFEQTRGAVLGSDRAVRVATKILCFKGG